MTTLTRRIGVTLTAALLATTALAPLASARDWHCGWDRDRRVQWQGDRRDHEGAVLALGLGLAALAGIAILSANQSPAPV
jgi:hypothetical protein